MSAWRFLSLQGAMPMRNWVLVAGLVVPCVSWGGFSIEGSPTLSTQTGDMGARTHYEREAKAAFRAPDADLAPKQNKYADADLVVDLAYKSVSQKGTGQASVVDGFAEGVPFAEAMRLVLPDGWQLYKSKQLERKAVPELVSFAGGKAWPDVLMQMGDRYALHFHLDWYDRTVMMSPGRESAAYLADRIKVIAEPVKPKPVAAKPAGKAEPVSVASSTLSLAGGQAKSVAAPADKALTHNGKPVVAAPSAQAAVVNKPVAPPKPLMQSYRVQQGTLYENVIRLSKEAAWEPPSWGIDADYKIPASYTISANNFAEAMVKLLMIHPVQADVNTIQRKVYVLKEMR